MSKKSLLVLVQSQSLDADFKEQIGIYIITPDKTRDFFGGPLIRMEYLWLNSWWKSEDQFESGAISGENIKDVFNQIKLGMNKGYFGSMKVLHKEWI